MGGVMWIVLWGWPIWTLDARVILSATSERCRKRTRRGPGDDGVVAKSLSYQHLGNVCDELRGLPLLIPEPDRLARRQATALSSGTACGKQEADASSTA